VVLFQFLGCFRKLLSIVKFRGLRQIQMVETNGAAALAKDGFSRLRILDVSPPRARKSVGYREAASISAFAAALQAPS
jgi:hypothetical protein